jgi:hypothetical protein
MRGMGEEEFQVRIGQRLLGVMESNGARRNVMPIDEIDKHMAKGEFVAASLRLARFSRRFF